MFVSNPWIASIHPTSSKPDVIPTPAAMVPPLTGAATPQKGIPEPDATDRLPRRYVSGSATLWVVGVHGGAGESTVTRLIDGSRSTQHTWPAFENAGMPPRVLLVCRSNMNGLESAQRALIEWAAPKAPEVELLGLAVLADAPGRLPRELRDFATIVAGGAPRSWHLPWVDAWRTGDVAPEQLPRETRKFVTEINSLLP
ncbi:DUF6668 family protein [Arthrobacter sp. CAL618]|uniref:DUF6668 family protein n=1 Tax=Arthrobacter sp. CAL618 TaxID=1055770 RepID=UPI0009FFEA38